jgi:hypothetical protein
MYIRNCLIALALLLSFVGGASAQKPDLSGATLILNGFCPSEFGVFPCSLYEKQGVRYIIYRDNEGEAVIILKVHDGAKMPYGSEDYDLFWSIEQERRYRV